MSFLRKEKVMYKCDKCSYTTNRKSNLNNHLKRKIPCAPVNKDKEEIICRPCEPIPLSSNVGLEDNESKSFQCSKCNREFPNKYNMTRHESKCDGLHPLQCKICLKMFASNQSKYWHKKNVKCVPVNSEPSKITNNNIHNDHCTTNNDNSITINLNFDNYNHDHVNVERLKTECRNLKSSLDCVVSYLNHVFFDPDHPERRLIALSNLRSDYKFIDVFRDNRWEKDTQHSVLTQILQKSFNLTTGMLKDEDPEHRVELDPDVEQTDNLKKFETNLVRDENNYRNRAKQKMKSEIYNKSVRLISSPSDKNQAVDSVDGVDVSAPS